MNGGSAGLLVAFTTLLVELLVLLFVVSSALALAVRRAGLTRVQHWLGGHRASGALKGIGLGFVVPFCTYSAVPAFVGMVDARVRTATLAGFLLAAPLLDPITLAVLLLLFGWQATLAYAAVIAAAVFAAALLADVAHADRLLRPVHRRVDARVDTGATTEPTPRCDPDPFADRQPWRGLGREAVAAAAYARTLLRTLALPMVIAVAVAAAIIGLVPEQLVSRLAGPANPLAVPTAALLGAPFYVSTEAVLPVAAALHANGMGLGAVFALVISAAGVNLPELALLGRLMQPRLIAAYTATILGAAVAAGYLVPLLL